MVDRPERQDGANRRAHSLVVLAGLLLIYVLGTNIPLPGLAIEAFSVPGDFLGGLLGGGTMFRLSIFSLGLVPLFTTLAFLELAKLLLPGLARWQVASAQNLYRLNDNVRIAALVLVALQGYGVASGLTGLPGAVADTASGFVVAGVATYVASTALLSWLADRITLQGLGNGFWLLLCVPTIASLPARVLQIVELARTGLVATPHLILVAALLAGACIAIVMVNLAQAEGTFRQAPTPQDGARVLRVRMATMALIWPPLLANVLIDLAQMPLFVLAPRGTLEFLDLARVGSVAHMLAFGVLILLLSLAYSRKRPLDWREIADVFETEPAPPRAGRLFWIVACVQIAVCVGIELLQRLFPSLPVVVSGASLILTVTVAMNLLGTVLKPLRAVSSETDATAQQRS